MRTVTDEERLIERARTGEREAFDALVIAHRAKLKAIVRRLVGHPDETDDIVQDALLLAWKSLPSYRGESAFGTWLCAIGVRRAVDHLRGARRWRTRAQMIYANECLKSPALAAEVGAALSSPQSRFEIKEHVAYCFACVGRALPADEYAALVLREIAGYSSTEAARALGITESVLRHRLERARQTMQREFEGLCALVGKNGVCYQCKGLRDAAPADRRGEPLSRIHDFDERLELIRRADPCHGGTQALHDLFWRRTGELEESGAGDETHAAVCGREPEAGAD